MPAVSAGDAALDDDCAGSRTNKDVWSFCRLGRFRVTSGLDLVSDVCVGRFEPSIGSRVRVGSDSVFAGLVSGAEPAGRKELECASLFVDGSLCLVAGRFVAPD